MKWFVLAPNGGKELEREKGGGTVLWQKDPVSMILITLKHILED